MKGTVLHGSVFLYYFSCINSCSRYSSLQSLWKTTNIFRYSIYTVSSSLLLSLEGPTWGTGPIFDSRASLQQPYTLVTYPHCTPLSNAAPYLAKPQPSSLLYAAPWVRCKNYCISLFTFLSCYCHSHFPLPPNTTKKSRNDPDHIVVKPEVSLTPKNVLKRMFVNNLSWQFWTIMTLFVELKHNCLSLFRQNSGTSTHYFLSHPSLLVFLVARCWFPVNSSYNNFYFDSC